MSISLTDIFGGVSAFIAGVAVTYSFVVRSKSRDEERTKTTVDVWKVWISKDYREARVKSNRAIIRARSASKNSAPNYDQMITDFDDEVALGSVEHFFYEVSKLKESNLLDAALFSSLLQRSINDWAGLLSGFERDSRTSFSNEELNMLFLNLGVADTDETRRFLPQLPPAGKDNSPQ